MRERFLSFRACTAAAISAATLMAVGLAGSSGALVRTASVAAAAEARSGRGTVEDGGELPARPPRRLSETGLYGPDGSVDPRNRPFTPQYPLWTDGAAKTRWVRLPDGATIDVSDVDAWRFPAGTTFWKEFSWGGRKVETRMIRANGAGAWTFSTYVWTDDQSDAVLAPEEGIPGAFEFAPGKRHSIPGTTDCEVCHRAAPSTVLGFSALQLSDDRDPLAPNAEPLRPGSVTLRSLVEDDRLRPPRPELAARPPRIRERDPLGRAALGYLSANCGGCHHAHGALARLGFVLLHDAGGHVDAVEPAQATTVGARSRFPVPGISAADARIVVPGAPAASALLHRMQSRRPISQMPPLGSVIADKAAVELVRRWIEKLGTPPALDADGP